MRQKIHRAGMNPRTHQTCECFISVCLDMPEKLSGDVCTASVFGLVHDCKAPSSNGVKRRNIARACYCGALYHVEKPTKRFYVVVGTFKVGPNTKYGLLDLTPGKLGRLEYSSILTLMAWQEELLAPLREAVASFLSQKAGHSLTERLTGLLSRLAPRHSLR